MPELVMKFNEEEIKLKELLHKDFEYHLKRKEGIAGYEKANRKRKAIIDEIEDFITKKEEVGELKPLTMDALYPLIKNKAIQKKEFEYFLRFLEVNGYKPKREVMEIKTIGIPKPIEKPKVELAIPPTIGRIALTEKSPGRPTEFTFWVTESKEVRQKVPIEPGRLVTATSEGKDVTLVGLITDVEAKTDMLSPTDSFYAYGIGEPKIEISTQPIIITTATVETIYRSDKKAEPPTGLWQVRPSTEEEIRMAYQSEIMKDDDEVLIGFTYDWQGNYVPIPAHFSYLLGYEAAHINIAGAAGVATKTSYALFLIESILARCLTKDYQGPKVAAIAFNVKEADLLEIDELPKKERIEQLSYGGPHFETARFWKHLINLQEPYPINPYELVKRFKFYAPESIDDEGKRWLATLRKKEKETTGFRYGALDFAETHSLHLMLDPEDLDDRSMALISSLTEEIKNRSFSIEKALDFLNQKFPQREREGYERWITIANTPHHPATILKVINRIDYAAKYQLCTFLNLKDPIGKPLPIWDIRPGDLWIIDISRLHDKGQRLIFHWIMKALHDLLEKKRAGQKVAEFLEKKIELEGFPDRVVIFVDELNKFAPAGAAASLIKRDIIEIAARGRSIGLSLIGAQQLASQVDEEILANCSTLVVGRSHPIEIGKGAYGWLAKGLKERATTLERGWMIVWHGAYRRAALIHFPKPLHKIETRG